jgi:hypothetical protein
LAPSKGQLGFTLGFTLGLAALSGLSLLGCTADEPTEIVAGVSTQIRVPDDLRSVGVVVQVGGRVQFCQTYSVTEGLVRLPATLGVLDERVERGPVTIQILGLRTEDSAFESDCVAVKPESLEKELMVIRRRRLSFVSDRIVYLPLPLKDSCRDKLDCEDDETCIGGKCVSAEIDAETLPDYDDSLVFGNTNTCFDGNTCMPKGSTVPVVLEDPETCTFQAVWPDDLPRPQKGGLNVRLFYDSFGSEILDLDAPSLKQDQREGFSFEDEDEPLRFRLAPNLCESNYQADKVLAVDASAFCPAKRALQPLCDDYIAPDPRVNSRSPGSGGGEGDGEGGEYTNSEPTGTCTLAGLRPVESVVYVLMDRSDSMYKFFGMGGLEFAIGLPLASPVAKRTKIGFDFLPPEADQCGTRAYATPLVPFGNVEAVRLPIAEILGGAELLPNDPPRFYLDAALLGAYQGVSAVPATGQRFNRRAVVVLSNRDVLNGACSEVDALTLAQNARAQADPVFTYAVALDEGEAGALPSATALAEAGGTTVFNGVTDEAEGALAVQKILTELGTCLYEVQRADAGGEKLPTSSSISYIDPRSPSDEGADVPHNAACAEDAPSDVSGWNQGPDGLVRLCGEACEDLRELVGDVGEAHLALQHIAPPVPLVVTAPCDEFVSKSPSQ